MRRGFTILELLVASLLLSMLVTMLSMIFNQSSIAWRTGTAGVKELDEVRANLGKFHDQQDDALPGVGGGSDTSPWTDRSGNRGTGSRDLKYRTVSIFSNWGGSSGYAAPNTGRTVELFSETPAFTYAQAIEGDAIAGSIGSAKSGVGREAFVVGVRSAGPDRKFETEDDITNWPEEVD